MAMGGMCIFIGLLYLVDLGLSCYYRSKILAEDEKGYRGEGYR